MVRAADAAGLASFAFTEHVFPHRGGARGQPLRRHALGRRARGPADRHRPLPQRDRRGRRRRARGERPGRPRARALARDPLVRPGTGRLRSRARRRMGRGARLGALPERRSLDLRPRDAPQSAEEAWDDYFERLGDAVEHGGYDVVTHPVRLAVSRPRPPRTSPSASTGWPDWPRRTTRRSRSTARTCASTRSSCDSCASRSDAPARPSAWARTRTGRRAWPASRTVSRCCAPRACARRWPSSTAAGATFPCDRSSAALGVRPARVRDQRLRALVPAARRRLARLRAGAATFIRMLIAAGVLASRRGAASAS